MPISISHVRKQLDLYLLAHPDETPKLAETRALLATERPWGDRSNMMGHVVATAIITNPFREILLVHHRIHQVWWPAGGHAESADREIADAALREAIEETGIDPAVTVLADPVPIHVEMTQVPANPGKGEPPHRHFDFRYWFTAPRVAVRPQESEVHGAAWMPISELDAPALAAALEARLAAAASNA